MDIKEFCVINKLIGVPEILPLFEFISKHPPSYVEYVQVVEPVVSNSCRFNLIYNVELSEELLISVSSLYDNLGFDTAKRYLLENLNSVIKETIVPMFMVGVDLQYSPDNSRVKFYWYVSHIVKSNLPFYLESPNLSIFFGLDFYKNNTIKIKNYKNLPTEEAVTKYKLPQGFDEVTQLVKCLHSNTWYFKSTNLMRYLDFFSLRDAVLQNATPHIISMTTVPKAIYYLV